MAIGEIQAHANGIAGLAIMTTTTPTTTPGARRRRRSTALAEGREKMIEGVGGLLVTCGNAEGIVKIWDYTHVEDGSGSCGRYVGVQQLSTECRHVSSRCGRKGGGGDVLGGLVHIYIRDTT